LTDVLRAAIEITRADMGNIQLFDPTGRVLQIKAQLGFDRRFLEFFSKVHEGEAACGEALKKAEQVVVEDVTKSPIFIGTDGLDVMLDARARAVQSTPLISKSGYLIGMLSTHYHTVRRPSDRDLRLIILLARRAARLIATGLSISSESPIASIFGRPLDVVDH
jgi:GAF domain-containing protein